MAVTMTVVVIRTKELYREKATSDRKEERSDVWLFLPPTACFTVLIALGHPDIRGYTNQGTRTERRKHQTEYRKDLSDA